MKTATLRLLTMAAAGVAFLLSGPALAADAPGFLEILRARAATFPVLEPSMEAGAPKFRVVRFNETPIVTAGERYGAVRVICPADKPLSLAWLFSDTMNVDEYDFIAVRSGKLDFGAQRHIAEATAHADPEVERFGRRASSLPRPWDIFQLHLWSVPAKLLQPGGEYLIWFRFNDRRPTDLCLAATFLDPSTKIDPANLPAIFGLPDLSAAE